MTDALSNLRAIPDPAVRASKATDLLAEIADMERSVAVVRLDAARELRAAGASYAQLGILLGVSKARAAQLLA